MTVRLLYGFLTTMLFLVLYKMMLPFVAPVTGDFVYTLILLITPAVLYMTFRHLIVHQWNYKLPFVPLLILGLVSTILAGIGIGFIDYIVLLNKLTLFGEVTEEPFAVPVTDFLYGYLTWYFWMGIVVTPLLYAILWLQLRRKKR